MKRFTLHSLLSTGLLSTLVLTGCTGQIPGSFRLAATTQKYSSTQDINTKIDMLWVVDNSASMDVTQQKLRAGFTAFATKYMQPTWDIHVAVITTDTYMANTKFGNYLGTTISGTVGWTSPTIQARLASWVNPSWNPNLVHLGTGAFTNGVKFGELVPSWGTQYALLLPGIHDGPINALCSELMPYFLNGLSACGTRDAASANTGTANCLNPGGGESSITQCVNTIQNDTVHSGKAVIKTMPPNGTPGNAAWITQLTNDFMINVTRGTAGQGSERGLGSVLQLLDDNEVSASAFFRPSSLRTIIFVSDEEDQTMTLPSSPAAGFNPQRFYKCDQASLLTLNAGNTALITGGSGYCCAGAGCRYGSEGLSCTQKTIDGYTYAPSVCPREDLLMPVADVKTRLDTFFKDLDGTTDPAGSANYFITSIVPLTGAAIQSLQAARAVEDLGVTSLKTHAVDRGDRYMELGTQVGNGSLALNIADNDYTPILDAIGRAIIEKKGTFKLDRAPLSAEDIQIRILHQDGSSSVVSTNLYTVSGKTLTISDINFLLTLNATDQISITYNPKTLN